jgi:signal transduction histidine kinase
VGEKAISLDGPKEGGRLFTVLIPKNNPNLLLVGATNGVLVYQRGLSKEYPWEYRGNVPGIETIGSYFFEAKDGMVFTSGGGKRYVLNPGEIGLETDDPTRIKVNVFDSNISDSYSIVDGEFYQTSPEGMKKYSSKEGGFVPSDDFSLLEKDMYDFTQFKSGILWYKSFDKKKYILKRDATGKFVKDERPNSLAPYLSQADFIDADSIMWFGTPKGLIRYDPKKDNQTDKEFFTLIRRIETKTDTLPLISYGRDKTLAAREGKDNSYRFEFAAPYFEDEKKTKYQTYLEGFDPEWIDWNDNTFKEYTNLPAGTYTFRVRAQAFTGRVSEEAVFSFVVLPPWYATWWAYLLYALLIFVVISAIVKWRSQKLRAENQVLEEKVKERTAELEQSYHNVELLGEIGRKITASLSAEKIISTVYTNVNALMEASILGIGIYHEDTQTLDFPATYENGAPLAPYSNSLQDPNRFAALCFNSGNEIVINDLNAEYGRYLQKMPTASGGEVPVSLIYLPLKVKGNKFGVITVQSFTKNAFSEYHLYMLRTIAVYTAIALENSESYQNLQQTLSSLKATQSQLIQSEKMASLGELTAGIAHEIQNPLNFVNNFSEVSVELADELKEELSKIQIDPSQKVELESIADDIIQNQQKINHHGKRAESIVKGMLQHSRSGSGKKEPTDLNALADEYLRLAYHGLRAKDKSFLSDFKADLDPDLPKVEVMPQDMGRVLLNLINNAFYAVNEKRKKLLESGDESFKPMVKIKTQNLGNAIEMSVSDNGEGIPESVSSKIFQPFFTTKPTGQGTGLGLSLSYDIVKTHGGEIKVISKEGEGTEFTIQLPSL